MSIATFWSGHAFGTNSGKLFLEIEGKDNAIKGTLRFSDIDLGLVRYSVEGEFSSSKLVISGTTVDTNERAKYGKIQATANLTSKGTLEGRWESDVGTGGGFILSPYIQSMPADLQEQNAEQLHTASSQFGPINIDKLELLKLADELQNEFRNGVVVVTLDTGTEQAIPLVAFKAKEFQISRANMVRLFVQEPDGFGLNRNIQIEFGKNINILRTQGRNEAWVLGSREKFASAIKIYEKRSVRGPNILGIDINFAILLFALCYLPEMDVLWKRIVLIFGVVCITNLSNYWQKKLLPLSTIYLNNRPPSRLGKTIAFFVTWGMTIATSIAAALLAAILQSLFPGWLPK